MNFYKGLLIPILIVLSMVALVLWSVYDTPIKQSENEWISLPQNTIESRIYSDTIYYPPPDINTIWKDSLHIIQTDSAGNIIKEFILYYR